jgi:hypothetical protein
MLCCPQEGKIPLLFLYCGDPLETFLRQIKRSQDKIECGHVEPDGIKPHGTPVKIDNNNSENTSQTTESEWTHAIY